MIDGDLEFLLWQRLGTAESQNAMRLQWLVSNSKHFLEPSGAWHRKLETFLKVIAQQSSGGESDEVDGKAFHLA